MDIWGFSAVLGGYVLYFDWVMFMWMFIIIIQLYMYILIHSSVYLVYLIEFHFLN